MTDEVSQMKARYLGMRTIIDRESLLSVHFSLQFLRKFDDQDFSIKKNIQKFVRYQTMTTIHIWPKLLSKFLRHREYNTTKWTISKTWNIILVSWKKCFDVLLLNSFIIYGVDHKIKHFACEGNFSKPIKHWDFFQANQKSSTTLPLDTQNNLLTSKMLYFMVYPVDTVCSISYAA